MCDVLFILLLLLTVASRSSSCPDRERVSLQCVGKEPPSVPVSQVLARRFHPAGAAVNRPAQRLQILLPSCKANCRGWQKRTEGCVHRIPAGTPRPEAVKRNQHQSLQSHQDRQPVEIIAVCDVKLCNFFTSAIFFRVFFLVHSAL